MNRAEWIQTARYWLGLAAIARLNRDRREWERDMIVVRMAHLLAVAAK